MTAKVIPACIEEIEQAVRPIIKGIDHLIIEPVSFTEGELPGDVEVNEDHPVVLLLEEIHELTDHLYWKSSELTDLLAQMKAKEKMARLRGLVKKVEAGQTVFTQADRNGGTSDE